MEDKFWEKIHEAQAFTNMAAGLSLAKTICRRKLIETEIGDKTDLILSIIAEVDALISIAETKALNAAK